MTFQLSGDGPEIYERVMVPLWFGRWAEVLVQALSLKPAENVLDVACGTGVTTRLAKDAVGPDGGVDGLDINATMIAKARTLVAGRDIAWIERDVCDNGLPSESYDVILSQHGYHYFPDKQRALREFGRLLVPAGRVGFSIWDGHSAYTRVLCGALERYLSPEVAEKQRSQRETPTANELLDQVKAAGFGKVEILRQELQISVPLAGEFVPQHLCSMPIAGAFMALDDATKAALVNEVAQGLDAYVDNGRIVYPDAVHLVIGRK